MPNTIGLAGRRSVFFVDVYKPLRLLLKLVNFHPVPCQSVPAEEQLCSKSFIHGIRNACAGGSQRDNE